MNKKDLKSKLEHIKLLVMDVDGTITDSGMYYTLNGEEFKRFSTRDGMAVNLLRKSGIECAILTSENSQIAINRAKKLEIKNCIVGSRNKSQSFKDLIYELNLEPNQVAYIGDDVNDYHVMKLAGFSACPNDATESIKTVANYICNSNGGYGAVRELAELILTTQNKPIILQENW